MAAIFSFKCSCCGKIHEGSPSFSFQAPDPYIGQAASVKKSGSLSSDLCHYQDRDGPHYFIRAVLEIPIHAIVEPFLWGIWVSLSEKNYHRYVENYATPVTSDSYFGWFCNHLPFYESTKGLKTTVHPQTGGNRPYIELQECDHQLSVDFHRGISIAKAQEIAEKCMHDG